MTDKEGNMKILIAVPCMDEVKADFNSSMIALRKPNCEYIQCRSSLIYDARNKLAEIACNRGFDKVLWVDSDMVLEPDTLERLLADGEYDYLCGAYSTRVEPIVPVVYESFEIGQKAKPFEMIPNEIFEIAGSGMGCVLMNTKLIYDVATTFGRPFSPILGLGEDLSFCYRVKQLGVKMFCDGSVRPGHVGTYVYKL